MKGSIFWKKAFIPVYFIVAFLLFLLLNFTYRLITFLYTYSFYYSQLWNSICDL